MTPKNTTPAKRQNRSSETIPANDRIAFQKFIKYDSAYEYILGGLTLAYFIYYIFKLFSSLGDTFFSTDENFHAYIASVIFEIKSLPARLPENIYGGYEYSYPPLFHILGAIVMSIAGFPALMFFNLILFILFIAGFYVLIRKHYGNSEALLACLLMSLSPVIAVNSIRFMTEMLSMVLIYFSFFYLVVAIKKHKKADAIISGLSTGLLILAKQIGIVVLGFYFILLVWFTIVRRKDVRLILYIIGTAVLVVLPYFIWALYHRIEIFGFVSLFLGTQPEWATAAVKSFRRYDSSLKEFAFIFITGKEAVVAAFFLIPIYHFIRTRAKDHPHNYIFIMTIYLVAVMVVWHITNSRHTIILLPFIAFLFGYTVTQIITYKMAINAVIVFLLIIASSFAYQMPNHRKRFNASVEFIELTKIIQKDNMENSMTLVAHAFDMAMYSRKPVIWPYPNLQTIPINLFEKQPPADLYNLLKKYRIGYILIDFQLVTKDDKFVGNNYPLSFVRNCETLTRQGKVTMQAISRSKQFVLLKVT